MAQLENTVMLTAAQKVLMSDQSAAELRRLPVLLTLTDRQDETKLKTAEYVPIDIPDGSGGNTTTQTIAGSAVNRAKANADWGSANESTSASTRIRWREETRQQDEMPRLDVSQEAVNRLDRLRREQVAKMNEEKEDQYLTYVRSLVTVQSGAFTAVGSKPSAAGSDATATNRNAGKILTASVGTAGSVFVAPSGDTTGTGADGLIRTAANKARLWLQEQHIYGGSVTIDGVNPGRVTCVAHPRLMDVFMSDLEDDGLQLDQLTLDLLAPNSDGPSIFATEAYQGSYRGMDFLAPSNPGLIPAAGTSWDMFFQTRQAIRYGESDLLLVQYNPGNHPTAPKHELRQLQNYGMQLVNRSQIIRYRVLSE